MARLLALHFDRSAHIDIDMVYHHFTVAGLVPPAEETSEAGGQALLTAVNAANYTITNQAGYMQYLAAVGPTLQPTAPKTSSTATASCLKDQPVRSPSC